MLKGFALGVALLIPGLSAGTLALIMGIYEKTFSALTKLLSFLSAFLSAFFQRSVASREKERDVGYTGISESGWFLFYLGVGVGLALFVMAKPLSVLLSYFSIPVYAFFMGLIIAGMPSLFKETKKTKPDDCSTGYRTSVLWIVFWTLLFFIVFQKSDVLLSVLFMKLNQTGVGQAESAPRTLPFEKGVTLEVFPSCQENLNCDFSNKISTNAPMNIASCDNSVMGLNPIASTIHCFLSCDSGFMGWQNPLCPTHIILLLFSLSGFLAVFASVLPGLSGSFLLLLIGAYHPALISLAEREWLKLIFFAIGGLLGLLSAIYIVRFFLKKHKKHFFCMAIGLIVASLPQFMPNRSWAELSLNQWTQIGGFAFLGGLLFFVLYRQVGKKKPSTVTT